MFPHLLLYSCTVACARTEIKLTLPLGVVNVLVTTPLWVVNTRLKLQGAKFRNEDIQPTHYRGIMGKIYQT